ncbi:MAG: energy-coupling factor ABC transporter permease [Planctomycetia bacterium]|nr:energy-coupling factor ABC transporter permease [Planctomycetia bacterium]
MHLPDGFLDAPTALAAAALATAGLAVGLRGVRRTLPPHRVPLLGTAAAFVFAAQMLNFPVAAGTSGHLVGATLATVLLGPFAAVVALTCVVVLQALLFQDGGVTALGANVLNMAVVAPAVAAAVHGGVARALGGGPRARLAATGFAAWCSTVAAAVACAGELAAAGTAAWGAVLPAMAGVHMLVGLGEGVATTLVVAAVGRLRPELVAPVAGPRTPATGPTVAGGLVVALVFAVFVAPAACGWPDGLEHVADALGFSRAARAPALAAPWGDYLVPGLGGGAAATAAAGALGAVVAFVVASVVAWRVAPRAPGRAP